MTGGYSVLMAWMSENIFSGTLAEKALMMAMRQHQLTCNGYRPPSQDGGYGGDVLYSCVISAPSVFRTFSFASSSRWLGASLGKLIITSWKVGATAMATAAKRATTREASVKRMSVVTLGFSRVGSSSA